MELQEVQETFFLYEEQKHIFIQETQNYFLERGLNPYIWFDENHRLRIKYKYSRKNRTIPEKQKIKVYETVKNFARSKHLEIRFIHEFAETDLLLPKTIQTQWSTEFIFEV